MTSLQQPKNTTWQHNSLINDKWLSRWHLLTHWRLLQIYCIFGKIWQLSITLVSLFGINHKHNLGLHCYVKIINLMHYTRSLSIKPKYCLGWCSVAMVTMWGFLGDFFSNVNKVTEITLDDLSIRSLQAPCLWYFLDEISLDRIFNSRLQYSKLSVLSNKGCKTPVFSALLSLLFLLAGVTTAGS